jgi:hypothetical protein
MPDLANWRMKVAIIAIVLALAMPPAFAQCQNGFANCWHCMRNTCWLQAGQVSYWGSLWGWFCNVSSRYTCGAGECNTHYLEVTSICEGTYYGN